MPDRKQFQLKRISMTEHGTFGVLLQGDIPFALTLEPPWINNEPFVSCIPADSYKCISIESPKFGNTYVVNNVLNRDHILFHKGNFGRDTMGCILIGEGFGLDAKDNPIITSSRAGFNEFMFRAGGGVIDLQITNEVRNLNYA